MTSKFIYVHDLGQNPLAAVTMGDARISSSHLRILHIINMEAIESAIEQVKLAVQDRAWREDVLGPLINLKVKKLVETHDKLRPGTIKRKKRWESLGSAWKYISGSPDAEDLRIINKTTNSLIDQNKEQLKLTDTSRIESVICQHLY